MQRMREKAMAVSHGSLYCVFLRLSDMAHSGIGRALTGRDSMVERRCFPWRYGAADLVYDLLYAPALRSRTPILPLAAIAALLRA